jgi:hypothetical protein
MKRRALLLLGLLLACGGKGEGQEADRVYVRVRNDTEFDFVTLSFLGREGLAFGPLRGGETSAYRDAEDALLYRVESGVGETAELRFWGQVTDHLGDEPMGHGYYTYEIEAGLGESIEGYDGIVFFQQR